MSHSHAIEKMITFYNGNLHDINHFLKVYAYAKTIGEQQQLDAETQDCLELAAIVHDIACPLCRTKYGSTNGKYQEKEGAALAENFLKKLKYNEAIIGRVCFLVAHHHTYDNIAGLDYQILLEADYLVNAEEKHYSKANIKNALKNIFKTSTGIYLLQTIYKLPNCC